MAILRKFFATGPRDWRDISRAYAFLLFAGWQIFVRRRRLDAWLEARHSASVNGHGAAVNSETVERAARWTNTAARHPFQWARCLQRSLALCMWLEREGIHARIRLGVRRDGEGIAAHAWVMLNGRVINDLEAVEDEFVILRGTRSR